MNDQQSSHKKMGTAMFVVAWLVFMGLVGMYFSDVLERQRNPNQELQTQYLEGGAREVVLERNRAGHYVTSGRINGQEVVFMLDTGATGVAIPSHIADRLDIPRGQPFQTMTANGIATAYATRLDSVSVGDITIHDVRAGISPGLQMDQVLLGMSFLRHIEFSQKGDRLILRQNP